MHLWLYRVVLRLTCIGKKRVSDDGSEYVTTLLMMVYSVTSGARFYLGPSWCTMACVYRRTGTLSVVVHAFASYPQTSRDTPRQVPPFNSCVPQLLHALRLAESCTPVDTAGLSTLLIRAHVHPPRYNYNYGVYLAIDCMFPMRCI